MSPRRPEQMSRLALGCYPLGGGYGTVTATEARATVDAALDAGWTLLDTAEAYLDSEVRLGEILEGRRDRVFLATKVFPSEPYRYENLRVALDNSLRRLRTDRIDLYQLHGPQDWVLAFPDAPPLEEVADALQRLLDSGDVRHVGVCNLPVATFAALRERVPLFSTQNLYSLLDQGFEDDGIHLPVGQEIMPWALREGVHVLAFSPLARGLLADGLDPSRRFGPEDERHFLPRFAPDVFPEWAGLANRLEGWARDHGRTLVQLAVAWTLANPAVSSTLIGAKAPRHIEAVAGAETWTLTPSDLAEIDELLATLPPAAAAARSIVWDHFPPEALDGMRRRRHGLDEPRHSAQPSEEGADMKPDERPLVVCRIENPPHMAEGVDEWMPKHFDDSLDNPAVTSVGSWRVLRDFDPTTGLPWPFNGHGNRFIVYVAEDMPAMEAFLDSPELREAIDDGVDRESAFPALDGEPFTGNIYLCSQVRGATDRDFTGPSAVFVERFEVGPDLADEFDAWLDGAHLDAVAALPEVAARAHVAPEPRRAAAVPLRPLLLEGQPDAVGRASRRRRPSRLRAIAGGDDAAGGLAALGPAPAVRAARGGGVPRAARQGRRPRHLRRAPGGAGLRLPAPADASPGSTGRVAGAARRQPAEL